MTFTRKKDMTSLMRRVVEDPDTNVPAKDNKALEAEAAKYWFLHGQAYDFTDFVASHPGGQKAILLGKGTDCTILFESYHTTLPSTKILDKYRVTNAVRLSLSMCG